MRLRVMLAAVLSAACFAPAAIAQPNQGQVVFSSTGGIYYASATLGGAALLTSSGSTYQAVQVNYANRSLLTSDTSGRVYRISSLGSTTTIATLNQGWATAMDLDQDQTMVIAATTAGAVKLRYTGTSQSVLGYYAHTVNGICRNTNSGNFAAVTTSPLDHVFDINRRTGAATTLATLTANPSGICYLPDVNQFAVTLLNTTTPLVFMTTAGSVIRNVYLGGQSGNCVTYNETQQQLYVGTTTGQVYRLNNTGTVQGSSTYSGSAISGIDVWDDQNISLNSTGVAGSGVSVAISFARSPSRSYCLAIALSMRTGIALPGSGLLNLAPDSLFFLTVCGNLPIFTTGFVGITSSSGNASGSFTLASGLPSGTRIYCAGAAVNPNVPGGLDFSNTEVVRVN